MYNSISFVFVKKNHPEALKSFKMSLEKSRSKNKDVLLQGFKFKYQTGERIDGGSFEDMLKNIGKKDKVESIDEVVARRVKNSSTHIRATHKGFLFSFPLKNVPQLVVDSYRESEEDMRKDRKAYAAKPKAERDADLEASLKELRKDPGFMEFQVMPQNPSQPSSEPQGTTKDSSEDLLPGYVQVTGSFPGHSDQIQSHYSQISFYQEDGKGNFIACSMGGGKLKESLSEVRDRVLAAMKAEKEFYRE